MQEMSRFTRFGSQKINVILGSEPKKQNFQPWISYRPTLDNWLKLRYDAINKMIGMLAEEITVNKGRAAYAGKVKAYCKTTDLILRNHTQRVLGCCKIQK